MRIIKLKPARVRNVTITSSLFSMAAELSEEAIAAARRSLDSAFSSGSEAGKRGRSIVDNSDDSNGADDDDDDDEEQGGTKEEALIGVISLSCLF